MTNYINQLNHAAFGSRMRNFLDVFVKDAAGFYKDFDLDFEPRWFSMFKILSDEGPLTVTEVAASLNQTHPAVNQVSNVLEKKGLIKSLKDKKDSRKRILKLTVKGKKLADKLSPFWQAIENATIDLLENTVPEFLDYVNEIEDAISDKSMFKRNLEQLINMSGMFEIVHYKNEYKTHFEELNFSWLLAFFTIEENDKKLLSQPKENIIDKEGKIIFAKLAEKIIGTCALIKWDPEIAELTKMAVDEKFRGLGIGRKLLVEMIFIAKKSGYKKLILLTSTKLISAIKLYKSAGFVMKDTPKNTPIHYTRETVYMELIINK